MPTANIISVSGGKDSLATWLLAIERNTENITTCFADTGHEHPQTYEYLDYLESKLGPIKRVKADFTKDIERKRGVVQTKWRKDLPEQFMADKPGKWVLKDGYRESWIPDDQQDNSEEPNGTWVIISPTGQSHTYFAEPFEPSDVYSPSSKGYLDWIPAIRGMSESEALDKTEKIITTALSVLHTTGIPFLDICLQKGRFPSTRRRFCSEKLKHEPLNNQVILPALENCEFEEVWSWQGVRADESISRSQLSEMEDHPTHDGLIIYRPILKWTAQDVFAIAKRHGIKPNPLYQQGMGRVGCMPCIHSRKGEIQEIAKRFPEELQRVSEWEKLVSMASKQQVSLLMDVRVVQRYLGLPKLTSETSKLITRESHGIVKYAEWSKTKRGGREEDLNQLNFEVLDEDIPLCSSIYGLCE